MIGVKKPSPQKRHTNQEKQTATLRVVTHQGYRAGSERELRRERLQQGVELGVPPPREPAHQGRSSREHDR